MPEQQGALELSRGSAVISPCGKYRYSLTREIGGNDRVCNFIMLNPSTADAETDDPTIRRCIGYAKAWGCGRLIVTNLFAFRATYPDDMLSAPDPVGPDNARHVVEASERAWNIYAEAFNEPHGLVVCAWGNCGEYMDQDLTTLGWIDRFRPMALKVSKTGQPCHPLYLPAGLQPARYVGRRANAQGEAGKEGADDARKAD